MERGELHLLVTKKLVSDLTPFDPVRVALIQFEDEFDRWLLYQLAQPFGWGVLTLAQSRGAMEQLH